MNFDRDPNFKLSALIYLGCCNGYFLSLTDLYTSICICHLNRVKPKALSHVLSLIHTLV